MLSLVLVWICCWTKCRVVGVLRRHDGIQISLCFDTISHHSLLETLSIYGIKHTELEWFTSGLFMQALTIKLYYGAMINFQVRLPSPGPDFRTDPGAQSLATNSPAPGPRPPDLRRLQRVPRHEKLGNYVTWPAWENSNVFLFNWCLYSSEISDCKSP